MRSRSDIQAGFDDALVAKRNAKAAICAKQTLLANGHHFFAAARQRAHDGCAAANVGAVAHNDSSRDATFHHGSAKCACVEVAEAFVHHGGAACEVCAKPNAAGIGNAHARRHHVVGHARKLVDAVNN